MQFLFSCDKTPRARKSYTDRTGMASRASISLAQGLVVQPEKFEDDNGNVVRVWTPADLLRWTFLELASTLINRVAVEPNEMLGAVPPSAIKYSVNKGWLIPNSDKTLYRITLKCALELDLPMRFRGKFNGRKIPFLNTTSAASKVA
jgi:hypothetical protein